IAQAVQPGGQRGAKERMPLAPIREPAHRLPVADEQVESVVAGSPRCEISQIVGGGEVAKQEVTDEVATGGSVGAVVPRFPIVGDSSPSPRRGDAQPGPTRTQIAPGDDVRGVRPGPCGYRGPSVELVAVRGDEQWQVRPGIQG